MFAHARCPKCAHEFVVEFANRSTTQQSLPPVDAPIRDDVPVCKTCGLIERLHTGDDSLAAARGCLVFLLE